MRLQVPTLKWKRWHVVLIVAAALLTGGLLAADSRDEQWRLPGIVETQEVRLGSRVGGRVAEVTIAEGDQVVAKQVLVRFEAAELEARRDQQRAALQAAEAQLERAKHGARLEEVQQARAELDSAEVDARLASSDFARANRLTSQGAMATADFESNRAARDRHMARCAALRARLALLLAGTPPEDVAEAQARVGEARGRLKETEAQLAEATVLAPSAAVVEVLSVRAGDLVAPNQPVVRVLRTDDLWVKVYVPETKLARVYLRQPVEVMVDGYPGRRIAGEVRQIAADSEFTPRNVQSVDERRHQVFGVRIRVAQPDDPSQRILKSGMAAAVIFTPQP
jgi:multidrug resistance efflux pump